MANIEVFLRLGKLTDPCYVHIDPYDGLVGCPVTGAPQRNLFGPQGPRPDGPVPRSPFLIPPAAMILAPCAMNFEP